MSKTKFAAKILFILLIGVSGVQTMVSCATGVGDESSNGSSTGSGGNPGQSNGSGSGNSSGSGNVGGYSSGSTGGNSSGSSYEPDEFCILWPPEPQKPSIPGSPPVVQDGAGKSYRTVVIGTQTWMAENLNYKPTSASEESNKCYKQDVEAGYDNFGNWVNKPIVEENCTKYGRLYNWATAQTACPSGWHLPTRDEWNIMKDFVRHELEQNCEDEFYFYANGSGWDYGWDVGTKLKAATGWKAHSEHGNGVDNYGFNAIGSGYCSRCNRDELLNMDGYAGETGEARWWTATENKTTTAYSFRVTYDSNVLSEKSTDDKTNLYSVRCVKN